MSPLGAPKSQESVIGEGSGWFLGRARGDSATKPVEARGRRREARPLKRGCGEVGPMVGTLWPVGQI